MDLKELLEEIVPVPELHAKWLNSLSLMENCGARKISAGEHPQEVDIIVLKHAAEEARHAYYLKSQIRKTGYTGCETYKLLDLLAPIDSYQYLHRLDVAVSKYLKQTCGFSGYDLKYASYLLVTYAIEVRADELYPIYESVLKKEKSTISVRMIIAEEKGHLEEMIAQMLDFFGDDWNKHGDHVLAIEAPLFASWQLAIQSAVQTHTNQNSELTSA